MDAVKSDEVEFRLVRARSPKGQLTPSVEEIVVFGHIADVHISSETRMEHSLLDGKEYYESEEPDSSKKSREVTQINCFVLWKTRVTCKFSSILKGRSGHRYGFPKTGSKGKVDPSSGSHHWEYEDLDKYRPATELEFTLKFTRPWQWEGRNENMMEHDIGTLIKSDDEFADIVIVCGDQEMKCHKVVLAAKSAVLRAMITSNFKERNDNRICLDQYKISTIGKLLDYIYRNKLPLDDKEVDVEFLQAAHFFQLHELVEECYDVLMSNITIENCCGIIQATHVFGQKTLFMASVHFLRDNHNEFLGSDKVSELLTDLTLRDAIIFQK